MAILIAAMLIVVGVIHVVPVSGVLVPDRLAALYGQDFTDPNLRILMQHRAVLFGLLGALLIAAAFLPGLRPVALIAGWVSVLSFLALAWGIGGYNDLVRRVVIADLVAVVCLAVATAGILLDRTGAG